MRGEFTFRVRGRRYRLQRRAFQAAPDVQGRIAATAACEAILRDFTRFGGAAELRRFAARERFAHAFTISGWSDAQVLRSVAASVAGRTAGSHILCEIDRPTGQSALVASRPKQDLTASDVDPASDDWIGFQLVDLDDNPLADRTVTIASANGARRTARSDAAGVATISRIASGPCQVTVAELSHTSWGTAAGPGEFAARPDAATRAMQLASSDRHKLRISARRLRVRLHYDPAKASTWDDTYTLVAFRGTAASRRTVRTYKDDQVAGDSYLDLLYDVEPGYSYTLEVDPGAGGSSPVRLFENHSFDALFEEGTP